MRVYVSLCVCARFVKGSHSVAATNNAKCSLNLRMFTIKSVLISLNSLKKMDKIVIKDFGKNSTIQIELNMFDNQIHSVNRKLNIFAHKKKKN